MSSNQQLVRFSLPITMIPLTLSTLFTTGYVLSYTDLFNSPSTPVEPSPVEDTTSTEDPRMRAEKFGFIIIFLLLLVFLFITSMVFFGREKNALFLLIIIVCLMLAFLTMITIIALTCYTIYLVVQAGVKKPFAITFLSFALFFQMSSTALIGTSLVVGVIQDREMVKRNISTVDRVWKQY